MTLSQLEYIFQPKTIGEMLCRQMGPDNFFNAIMRKFIIQNKVPPIELINFLNILMEREKAYQELRMIIELDYSPYSDLPLSHYER